MVTPVLADVHVRGESRVELHDSCNCSFVCCLPFKAVARKLRTTEEKVVRVMRNIRNLNDTVDLP